MLRSTAFSALRASPNTTFHSGEPSVARLRRRRRREIEPADHDALRQLQLEVAHPVAADGAAEARDGRFADFGAARDLGVGGVDREGDVGEDDVGDPAFGRAQLGIEILDLRQDVGDRLGVGFAPASLAGASCAVCSASSQLDPMRRPSPLPAIAYSTDGNCVAMHRVQSRPECRKVTRLCKPLNVLANYGPMQNVAKSANRRLDTQM